MAGSPPGGLFENHDVLRVPQQKAESPRVLVLVHPHHANAGQTDSAAVAQPCQAVLCLRVFHVRGEDQVAGLHIKGFPGMAQQLAFKLD